VQLIRTRADAFRTAALAIALISSTSAGAAAQAVPKSRYMADGSFQFGARGQPGAPDRAVALAVASDRRIHIVDARGLVLVYDSAGVYRRSYGDGQLDNPIAIALRHGESYVLDAGAQRVHVFGPGGQPLRSIGEKGSRGGQLGAPVDLALGPSGHLFVLDRGRKAIGVFSLDGTFVRDVPLGESVGDPTSLAVARDGTLLVADARSAGQIHAFPAFDQIPWTEPAPRGIAGRLAFRGAQLGEPIAVAVNELGTVVVLDNRSGRLFGRNLSARVEKKGPNDLLYGGIGSGRGSFNEAMDVTFAGRDEILILDRELRKVERIHLTTEGGLTPLAEHGYPIRVTRVARGLPAPLLDIGHGADGAPLFLMELDRKAVSLQGAQHEMVETVYGDSVRVFRPDPAKLDLRLIRELGEVAEGAVTDSLIVVTDPGRDRFAVFALPTGALVGTFGDNYRDNRRLRDPRGLGILPDGRIVIADAGNERLKIFSADLASLVANYPVTRPGGVAISPSGDIYVWNDEGTQIGKLNSDEGRVVTLDRHLFPDAIADMTFDRAGNVFVLDRITQRVTILDATLSRVLVQLGAEGGLDHPTRLRVDEDGNIYIADEGFERTVVFRWDVEVPGLAGLDLRYDGQVAELRWETSTSGFVRGYEVQGAANPAGPYTAIGQVDAPPYRLEPARLAEPPRYVRIAPVLITGVRGSPTEAQPLSMFSAAAAYERGDYESAMRHAREGVRLIDEGMMDGDERVKGRLLRVGFFSAYAEGDLGAALNWAKEAALIPMPREELIDFLFKLAEVYLRLGDPRKASQQILALVAQDAGMDYFRDPAVIDQSFRVHRQLLEAGYPEEAVEFLRLYARSIPAIGAELSRQYADSIAVLSTRARLAPGLTYWREANYGQVVSFFEDLFRQGGLSVEEIVVGNQLLAAAYYAFGNKVAAADAFREILSARPGFDLEQEMPRLQRLYDVTIYNTQTRRFFGAVSGT
jgi:sugar lactone lactonase YvrE/tetratricopeptide (TPR) repeat protein